AWQQNAALYACSPAAAVVEETVGVWLKELLRLPASASFALVTGCQMAHVTCLAAARHSLLAKLGWDVETQGLSGAPAIRILTSGEPHPSSEAVFRFIGMEKSKKNVLSVEEEGQVTPAALEAELNKEPTSPTLVLLQAGDINIGAYDSFETV